MPRWAATAAVPSAGVGRLRRTAPPGTGPPQPPPNAFGRVGYGALVLYLFLYLSRLLDVTLPGLKITMALNLIFLGGAVLSGGILGVARSRVVLLLGAFYAWMAVSFPFSVWKGGSVPAMIQLARALVLMVAIIALVRSGRDCLRMMYTIGLAGTTAGLVSVFVGEESKTERLTLTTGSFSDPNFYCAVLYVGLPFLWLGARNARSPQWKALYMAATLPVLAAGVATGSRTGFVALCAMAAVLFLRLPAARKLRLIIGAGLMLAAASAVFSDYILQRYTNLFGTAAKTPGRLTLEEAKYLETSAASLQSRRHLLERSLVLTLQHPLFGVGPGMFPVAEDQYAKQMGERRGGWHDTHNTYTQVSSEAGLPAALFFCAALLTALRILWRVRKALAAGGPEEQERLRHAAIYLEVAFAGALTAALFLSIAYTGLLYVVMGLIVALERVAAQEAPPAGGDQPPRLNKSY